jgi:hypothetical protein
MLTELPDRIKLAEQNNAFHKLTDADRAMYLEYKAIQVGLDVNSSGLQWLTLSGKMLLYATRHTADQLATRHGLSVSVTEQTDHNGVMVVTATAKNDTRAVDDVSACKITGADGTPVSHDTVSKMVKICVTQAKRRAILSFVGLSCMDETEVDAIEKAGADVHRETAAPSVPTPPAPSAMAAVKGWLISMGVRNDKSSLVEALRFMFRLQPGAKPQPSAYDEALEYIQTIVGSMSVVTPDNLVEALNDAYRFNNVTPNAPPVSQWTLDEYAYLAAALQASAAVSDAFDDE